MADKKITDLQLRDDVDGTLNFASDDAIQSYRVTAEQIKDFVLANGGILGDVKIYSSNDTWNKPTGLKSIIVEAIGGGGGGGGAPGTSGAQFSCAGGGGGGGYVKSLIDAGDLGSSETVTIGGGGSGGSGGNGSSGGNTTFGGHVQADGGSGGIQNGPAGSISTVDGVNGGNGSIVSGTGFSRRGGAGGGAFSEDTLSCGKGGAGGDSQYGAGGPENYVGSGKQNGADGTGYGGGGAGSCNGNSQTNASGGDGTSGLVVVWEFF